MEEAARLATEADLDRVSELWQEAIEELRPTRGGEMYVRREARSHPVRGELEQAIADENQIIVVATLDEEVFGFAVGQVEEIRGGEKLGVIKNLYVDPSARSVGLGESLMGELLPWFGTKGCSGVDAIALPGNRATKNFFEASGFTARLLVMHHRMSPGK